MRGERLQSKIVNAELQPPAQLDRAHDGVYRQLGPGHLSLGGQERIVECDIVCHQRATTQQLNNITDDVGELWLIFEHAGRQPVDVSGPRIHPGLSRLTKDCSTLPSASRPSTAMLMMRA